MKQFYTHLVGIESIIVELERMELSKEEKLHLAHLIDTSLHHTILDAVLSELSKEDKARFIIYLNENNHDKIWHFLNEKVDDVEKKIKQAANDLKKELEKDIKEARKSR